MLHPNLPPLPARIRKLPVDERGFPVPWFVQWFHPNGTPVKETFPGPADKPDFRVIDSRKRAAAVRQRLCWVCGEPLGVYLAFVIGPMCAVNRISSEPPAHRECAEFSACACPFLTKPKVERREGLPAGTMDAAGVGLERNPGVALVWITRSYKAFRAPQRQAPDGRVSNEGALFKIGDPIEALWFAEGRRARREEIMASIDSGMPLLREAALLDGGEAVEELSRRYDQALQLVA
jgi:hypothetical protein